MRPGVRLAVDVGTVRVGLARSDAGAVLALPLQTLTRQDDASELDEIARIAGELNAIEIVVGLPRHMQGGEGISAKGARRYARKIKMALPACRVCLVDERLSSHEGHERLLQAGVGRREHRQMIDQVAASIILETALEMERMSGQAPGREIVLEEGQRLARALPNILSRSARVFTNAAPKKTLPRRLPNPQRYDDQLSVRRQAPQGILPSRLLRARGLVKQKPLRLQHRLFPRTYPRVAQGAAPKKTPQLRRRECALVASNKNGAWCANANAAGQFGPFLYYC